MVRQQHVLSSSKNILVQSANDFAGACEDPLPVVEIHFMTQEHLNSIESIWDRAKQVNGISKANKAILKHGELSIYANTKANRRSITFAFEDQLQPEKCKVILSMNILSKWSKGACLFLFLLLIALLFGCPLRHVTYATFLSCSRNLHSLVICKFPFEPKLEIFSHL